MDVNIHARLSSFFLLLSSLGNKPDLYLPCMMLFISRRFSGTFLGICFKRVICDIAWCSAGESLLGCYVLSAFSI